MRKVILLLRKKILNLQKEVFTLIADDICMIELSEIGSTYGDILVRMLASSDRVSSTPSKRANWLSA